MASSEHPLVCSITRAPCMRRTEVHVSFSLAVGSAFIASHSPSATLLSTSKKSTDLGARRPRPAVFTRHRAMAPHGALRRRIWMRSWATNIGIVVVEKRGALSTVGIVGF